MIHALQQPWPWYVAGPLLGLVVPALLLMGNRHFGISANLRHICAACFPSGIAFFQYNWKQESWNLLFAAGIVLGAALVSGHTAILPPQLSLYTVKGWLLLVSGGFLVGFGTRYAGGCTSGHAIMGLSTLQWPSLVATIMFMAGGVLMSNLLQLL